MRVVSVGNGLCYSNKCNFTSGNDVKKVAREFPEAVRKHFKDKTPQEIDAYYENLKFSPRAKDVLEYQSKKLYDKIMAAKNNK